MIGWLQGEKVENWHHGNRQGVLIVCGGVGYEVQTTSRHLNEIDCLENPTLWIHHLQREDLQTLFGFPNKSERDLFRLIIGVNGVGPQLALALLNTFRVDELTKIIVHSEIKILCEAQGVGKRIAERLIIELRAKLSQVITDNNTDLNQQTSMKIRCLEALYLIRFTISLEE